MTDKEFAKCMAVLSAGVGRDMPKEMASVWFTVLGDMTAQQLQASIVHSLREHKFAGFPPVGLLRQIAGVSAGVMDADGQAIIAWHTVVKAIGTHGAYRSVDWSDPAIPAAIETVAESWVALCDISSEELHRFIRPKFMEAWKAHRANGTSGSSVTTGILAEDAGRLGYEPPAIVAVDGLSPPLLGFGGESEKRLTGPREDADPESVGAALGQLVKV